jgi:hypothetical protein
MELIGISGTKREYLKDWMNEPATHIKNKNLEDIYQWTTLVKDKTGDLLADSHNILNNWKNYFT